MNQTRASYQKRAKADYKVLGPKYGKQMKTIAKKIASLKEEDINKLISTGSIDLKLDTAKIILNLSEVIILSESLEGLSVAQEGRLTVAVDTRLSDELLKRVL